MGDMEELLRQARFVRDEPQLLDKAVKCFAPGFTGFSELRRGDRVLINTDSLTDRRVTEAIAQALREVGAYVDIVVTDWTEDREIEEIDEVRASIRREPWVGNEARYVPRRYNDVPWITKVVRDGAYNLLVQGKAYPNDEPFRWEGIPWPQAEQFLSQANTFPRELHELINRKSWAPIWTRGKGSRVHITDPEGTDLSYTLLPESWGASGGMWFNEEPYYGHLMYHPGPPISSNQDATGVVSGTIAHIAKPFPLLRAFVRNGLVTRLEGGGLYGEAWRELLDDTREIQYPQFPARGLFWLWEIAVGTNPRVSRPSAVKMLSTGGSEWERWRSGIVHLGFGTAGPSEAENWAGEQGYPYGHLHIHLQFPTVRIHHQGGGVDVPIKRGRLAALDDPEVRECASQYGDPDELLTEVWVPPVPGISVEGDYESYAADPSRFFGGADDKNSL